MNLVIKNALWMRKRRGEAIQQRNGPCRSCKRNSCGRDCIRRRGQNKIKNNGPKTGRRDMIPVSMCLLVLLLAVYVLSACVVSACVFSASIFFLAKDITFLNLYMLIRVKTIRMNILPFCFRPRRRLFRIETKYCRYCKTGTTIVH